MITYFWSEAHRPYTVQRQQLFELIVFDILKTEKSYEYHLQAAVKF